MKPSSHSPEKRVSVIRKLLKVSQSEFAKQINISQGALSQIENEKIHLSIDTLLQICNKYNISADWLIYGIKNMYRETKLPSAAATPQSKLNSDRIVLIDVNAHADYLKNIDDKDYVKSLDAYRIPGFKEGNFRMFEVTGDSMEPSLYNDDIVVVEMVQDLKKMADGQICVIVTDEGIVVKRVYVFEDDNKRFVLRSDNPKYQPYKILYKDILEAWSVKAKITSEFLTEKFFDSRYNALEERIKKLEEELDKLKKQ